MLLPLLISPPAEHTRFEEEPWGLKNPIPWWKNHVPLCTRVNFWMVSSYRYFQKNPNVNTRAPTPNIFVDMQKWKNEICSHKPSSMSERKNKKSHTQHTRAHGHKIQGHPTRECVYSTASIAKTSVSDDQMVRQGQPQAACRSWILSKQAFWPGSIAPDLFSN